MVPERRVVEAKWGRGSYRLTTPYDLSFAKLAAFDSVWVRIEDDLGRIGLGEAVALPGYGAETADDVARAVADLMDGAAGYAAARLADRCGDIRWSHPFAASAVMTALDLPDLLANHRGDFTVPLNVPVSGVTPLADLRDQVRRHLADGYSFIKVKVGRDVEAESGAARLILGEKFDRPFKVSFDANQAFSVAESLRFARVLADCAGERLLWLEQPVDQNDWDAMAGICRHAAIPIVLDEAIHGDREIDSAAAIGAHGVKLKLCKNFGPRATLASARRASDLGLAVVFGNGVATDIGNLAELLVMEAGSGLFASPSESSGFVKLTAPLLPGATAVGNGHAAAPLAADALGKLVAAFAG